MFFTDYTITFITDDHTGQCHYNSAMYWNENRGKCSIVEGYVLQAQNVWLPHSFITS